MSVAIHIIVDPKEELFDKVIGESGTEPADWHIFDRAFTNSSTTDIALCPA